MTDNQLKLGHKKSIIKSDQEPAILDLINGVKTILLSALIVVK